jgi:hypothetical protein
LVGEGHFYFSMLNITIQKANLVSCFMGSHHHQCITVACVEAQHEAIRGGGGAASAYGLLEKAAASLKPSKEATRGN